MQSTSTTRTPRYPKNTLKPTSTEASTLPGCLRTADIPTSLRSSAYGSPSTSGAAMPRKTCTAGPASARAHSFCSSRARRGSRSSSLRANTPSTRSTRSRSACFCRRLSSLMTPRSRSPRSSKAAIRQSNGAGRSGEALVDAHFYQWATARSRRFYR